ncbi:hypothetical protein RB213_009251 [Colletotrichum asianum]
MENLLRPQYSVVHRYIFFPGTLSSSLHSLRVQNEQLNTGDSFNPWAHHERFATLSSQETVLPKFLQVRALNVTFTGISKLLL